MKRTFTLIALFFTLGSFSQVTIKETNVNISGGKNGFEIEIPYADKKTAEKELKNLFKGWKGKFEGKDGVMKSDDCKNKSMGENTFDVYGMIVQNGEDGSTAMVAVDLGGAYLSSSVHDSQFKVMEGILKTWGVETAQKYVEEEQKAAEKILKEQEKELENLIKEEEKMEKEIEDAKKKIADSEKAIEDGKKSQEEKKGEITEQKATVEAISKKRASIK